MSSDDKLSSTILSNVDIVAYIYRIIQYAGIKATRNKDVQASKNNICTIKPYVPGQNRVTADCVKSTLYGIEYNPDDIMIVGGAALNIYDYKLKEFKIRRKLGALEDYIKKKTSDIDIVWWPRPDTDKEVITSKSEAIIQLIEVFKNELIMGFSVNTENIEKKIKPFITNANNSDKLVIDVTSFHTWKAGVFNISITFKIKSILLKICDIAIHDSGSSQRFDADGKEITDLRFMIDDPIYCAPNPMYSNAISYFNITGVNIAVPNIWSFVEQQMFAFDNLVRSRQIKSFINYKRVEFIKLLLHSFKLNNTTNKQNYKNLMEVFKTSNPDYITILMNEIDTRVDQSVYKENSNILYLCNTINSSKDTIINELCAKSQLLIEIPTIVDVEISNLEKIKERIINKSRQTNYPQFKKSYNELIGEIVKIQTNLKESSPIEILKTQYSQERPSTYIQRKEQQINTASKQLLNKREANLRRNRETRKTSMAYSQSYPPPPPPNYYAPYGQTYYQPPPPPPIHYQQMSYQPVQSMYPPTQSYYRGRGKGRNNKTHKRNMRI